MPQLVQTAAALESVLPALAAAEFVAVDTEFHPEKAYYPRLMLVQLCPSGGEPILVDALAPIDLRRLGPALSSVPWLVHGGGQDIQLLRRHAAAVPTAVFDTQVAAGFASLGFPRRLGDLVEAVLGVELDKSATLSDWSRRPLGAEQLRYASEDVEVLGALAAGLRERVDALGNTAWMARAQAEALVAALTEPPVAEAWRRVPGAHLLGDTERATLAALAGWREGRARQLDLPAGHVVADSILFELARRRPTTLDGLRENRRMPSQVWRQYGGELLAIISAAAEAEPPEAAPRGLRADTLRLAVRILASNRGLAAELVLPDCELAHILGGKCSGHWGVDALAPHLDDFIGQRSTILADGTLLPTVSLSA